MHHFLEQTGAHHTNIGPSLLHHVKDALHGISGKTSRAKECFRFISPSIQFSEMNSVSAECIGRNGHRRFSLHIFERANRRIFTTNKKDAAHTEIGIIGFANFPRSQMTGETLSLHMRESARIGDEKIKLFATNGLRQRVKIVIRKFNIPPPGFFQSLNRLGENFCARQFTD